MLDPSLSPRKFRLDEVARKVEIVDRMMPAMPERVGGREHLRFRHECRKRDFSSFNRFVLTAKNRGDRPVLIELKLYHASGNTEDISQAMSLSGGREVLDPYEEKEIHFPIEAFGVYGRPDYWKDITAIEAIFKTERGEAANSPLQVDAGPLYAEHRLTAEGPRLTAEGLQSVLKKHLPERHCPYPMTKEDLLLLRIPAPHPFPQGDADAVLHGRIMGYDLTFPFPWHTPPSAHLEWAHFFHRHHFLREILLAFDEDHDQRYIAFIRDVLMSWIKGNPICVGSNGGAGPAWETLSTAWRLRLWLFLKKAVWQHEAFHDEAKQYTLCSLWEHARHLLNHQGHPNNWQLIEAAALALAGISLPEFQEASQWRDEGMARLADACGQQFLPDGIHFEGSPLYHALCLQAILEVRQAAAMAGCLIPENITGVIGRAASYLGALCRPDFTWPAINDSGSAGSDYTALMHAAGRILDRPDLTWHGTRGKDGMPPDKDFLVFPYGLTGVMRTAPSSGKHYLVFRAAPPGAFHQHEDCLSIDVATDGVPRLVDPGITAYAPTALTSHYRSAGSHNMMLIDGKGPVPSPALHSHRETNAGRDFIHYEDGPIQVMSGICRECRTGMHCSFFRTVIFVDRSYWVIHDGVMGSGEGILTACWQYHPTAQPVIRGKAVIVQEEGLRGFALSAFTGAFDISLEQRWVSLGGRDIPAPQARYIVKTNLPCHFFWLLQPFSGQRASCRVTKQMDDAGGAIRLEIRHDNNRRDILMLKGVPSTVEDWERTGPGRVSLFRQDGHSGEKDVP